MARWAWTALMVTACTTTPPVAVVAVDRTDRPAARPSVPPTLVASAEATEVDASAAPVASADECPAIMFTDNKPGTRGLHVFEDGAGMHGYKDAAGRVVIPARFRFAYEFSKEGLAAVIDGTGRPAFIDTNGAVKAEAYPFDNGPDYFSSGRARIVAGGKVGFIDERGSVVVAPRWDGATAYCGEIALVCNGCRRGSGDDADVLSGGTWGAVDRSGRERVPLIHKTSESARRAAGVARP